ncbi:MULTISPECIES: type I glutamate--ammonia ligase [Methanobacterium]|uniref:Glutamine synthetase n=1 Tax=Methanobacterium veterum TaxID=408577 RepID=A0A9E4ZTD0_9EURY|nr:MULTISPECIES: type I glutamate--ammonia ligase [Methanobacterium]MCZ3365302.1 type I glutamate--ammonia ligase [Methanobacterium veterum]MCZ3373053.1 type I glutamate--ammonia ligase [Methanobacterium veterum]
MSDKIGQVIENIEKCGTKFVRLQFVDIHGTPKNMAIPLVKPDQMEDILKDGLLFDGSSVEGFVDINESDLILKPDPDTFSTLPWRPEEKGVCRFICDVYWPEGKPFEGDPRYILKRALEKAEKAGYEYNVGPEPEFFILDQDEEGNLIPNDNGAYFDVEPVDQGTDIRRQLVMDLEALNFDVEVSHHEVAPGQHEIDFKFDNALKTADAVITFKQAIKAIVDTMGYMVTFMPKPFFGENGSGMHCHQSLFKGGENVFYDPDTETQLSQEAMYFMGGLLQHSPALTAICAPTINSYKRLVPGYEAPVYVAYGLKNRSTLVRIPASRGKGTRVELRMPDPSCNPYLAFAAMLEAGLDGMKNKVDPGEPTEIDVFGKSIEELKTLGIDVLPSSLWEAYHALEKDDVVRSTLGDHIYTQFRDIKKAEWDDYRIQVFDYELDKYLTI